MLNKIIDAICKALNEEFGTEYEIYTDLIEQDLKEPCFSVYSINPTNDLFRNNKYYRENLFGINYFPKTAEKSECNDIVERLYNCLEYINIQNNGKTRGTKMHSEFSDGVLIFFVDYDMYVYKQKNEEDDSMESYAHNTDLKG